MKTKVFLSLIIIATVLNSFSIAADKGVAFITSVKGEVSVFKGAGNKVAGSLGTSLDKNDEVVLGKGAKVVIYFTDGSIFTLDDKNNRLVMGSDPETSILGGTTLNNRNLLNAKTATDLKPQKKAEIELAISTPAVYRSGGIVPASPAGFVYSLSPEFIWIDSTAGNNEVAEKTYMIVVTDEDNNVILKEEVKGKTNFVNRFTSSKLSIVRKEESQRFYWDVYAAGKEPKRNQGFELDASFTIIGKAEADKVKRYEKELDVLKSKNAIDLDTYYILSAMFKKENNLYCDATSDLTKLIEKANQFLFPYQECAWMYSQLGKNAGIMVKFYAKSIDLLSSN